MQLLMVIERVGNEFQIIIEKFYIVCTNFVLQVVAIELPREYRGTRITHGSRTVTGRSSTPCADAAASADGASYTASLLAQTIFHFYVTACFSL